MIWREDSIYIVMIFPVVVHVKSLASRTAPVRSFLMSIGSATPRSKLPATSTSSHPAFIRHTTLLPRCTHEHSLLESLITTSKLVATMAMRKRVAREDSFPAKPMKSAKPTPKQTDDLTKGDIKTAPPLHTVSPTAIASTTYDRPLREMSLDQINAVIDIYDMFGEPIPRSVPLLHTSGWSLETAAATFLKSSAL
jgi:hypothetical protein